MVWRRTLVPAFRYKDAEHVHSYNPLVLQHSEEKTLQCFTLFSYDYFVSSSVASLKTISNLARQNTGENSDWFGQSIHSLQQKLIHSQELLLWTSLGEGWFPCLYKHL